jgi:manganese/zinc/iron transport system permease protein
VFWTYTVKNVLLGASLLGLVGGVLGGYTLLRRQSLLGDALAHAALPGVCLAFLLTGTKATLPLLGGALVAGILGALYVLVVVRGSRVKEDAAIGIVLSVFYAVGIVLLTRIQKLPGGNQSGLDKFLFGQAAALVGEDLVLLAIVGGAVLATLLVLHKELKLVSFDRAFGSSLGFPVRGLEVLLTCLLVVVVVVGLQMVGVVLMVAALITPAAAARQWTDRFGRMLLVSGAIGAFTGAGGALASAQIRGIPTGPAIVLVSSAVLVVSLLLAPRRGILWAFIRERLFAAGIRRENLLRDLYLVGEREGGWDGFTPPPALMGLRGHSARRLFRIAIQLAQKGWVERSGDDLRLTTEGLAEAEQVVRKHRLWEVYLTRRLDLPRDHVHRDAEAMEHALSEEAVNEFEERLGFPAVDPHGRPIPPRRRAPRVS